MAAYARLTAFVAAVVGIGFAIGTTNLPGDWYAGLAKPPFNPPNWVFAPVWSAIYVLIAVAGWRTWERSRGSLAMGLWALQMLLNFLWSPVFFSAHRIGAALVILVALLFAVAGFIAIQVRGDRIAAALFVPYAAWLSFAAMLNGSVWLLN